MDVAYVRYRDDLPANVNMFAATYGFQQLGYKVVSYEDDVPDDKNLLTGSVLVGNIGDVWQVLKLLSKPIPEPIDYPQNLQKFLGRNIHLSTLGAVRKSPDRVFVKPVQQKLFTGMIWDGKKAQNRLSLAVYDDKTPVWVSDIVNFVTEYRCFVFENELVDVKHYNGDWTVTPDRNLVHEAVTASIGKLPSAYSLDFGVDVNGRTLLVEANDAYALGCYGLNPCMYARMIETRWEQLVK
jgi:hypothetical protein